MTALRVVKQAPDPTVVERLEEFLAMAKSGELRSVAIVGTGQDGSVLTAIINEGAVSAFTMIGAIERLKLRYHNTTMED